MYAVIFTYNFDEDSSVYLFEDEELAKEFLYESFCEERRIETEENEWDVDSLVAADRTYALISHSDIGADGEEYEDICEYRLSYNVTYIGKKTKNFS